METNGGANPDQRNKNISKYSVRVYFMSNAEHIFPARDLRNAREIAKRICMEGVWIVNDDNTEEFYPTNTIYKCKIFPSQKQDNFALILNEGGKNASDG